MRMKLFSLSVLVSLSGNVLAANDIVIDVNLQTPVAATPEAAVSETVNTVINAIQNDTRTNLTATQIQDRDSLKTTLENILAAPESQKQIALKLISPRADTANATVTRRNPVGFNLQAMGSRFALLRQSAKTQRFSFVPHSRNKSGTGFSPYVFSATDPLEKGGLFDNRLSTFFSIDYASSKQSETQTKTAFNGGASAFTGGMDYRLNPKSFVGLALTYASTKVDLSTGGGLHSKAFSLNTYGAYYLNENITLQGSVGLGSMNYDMSRKIQFTTGVGTTPINTVANSNPDGSHYSVSLGAAYDKSIKQYSGGVFAQFNVSNASINAFNETGAGGLNLHVASQMVKSRALNLGGQLSAVFGTRWGVVTPYLKGMFTHEFNKDDERVKAYFINDPSQSLMSFNAQTQDANFISSILGSSFVLPRGIMGFVQMQFTYLIQNYSQTNFSIGVRKEL